MTNLVQENESFLKEQLITYLGNKRKLLPYIDEAIQRIIEITDQTKFYCADLFSGSGVVARLLKRYSYRLAVNDLEQYSRIINECYLTNIEDFNEEKYETFYDIIQRGTQNLISGVISNNYAPKNQGNIEKDERVFYTPRNAQYIDTVRGLIDQVDCDYQKFFLAPLLYEASVHANTSGVFKGFYKDSKTGIGKFGGNAENCLNRILADIVLPKPIFSNFSCEVDVYQEDTNQLVNQLHDIDIAYLDPPYNQHPYGSNYFMLNTIASNRLGSDISRVSGIPKDWNKSDYNKKNKVLDAFDDLIKHLDSKYIIISYNSEGFMSKDDIIDLLTQYGELDITEIRYNTFRGSRNLKNRDIHVNEYLFTVCKS